MGIANYMNLSELMNGILEKGQSISISELVKAAESRAVILASEGERADRADLENGFIELVNALYRAGAIKPNPQSDSELDLIRFYESGKLAANGYGGEEGDRFLEIKWIAVTDDLPVIINLNI